MIIQVLGPILHATSIKTRPHAAHCRLQRPSSSGWYSCSQLPGREWTATRRLPFAQRMAPGRVLAVERGLHVDNTTVVWRISSWCFLPSRSSRHRCSRASDALPPRICGRSPGPGRSDGRELHNQRLGKAVNGTYLASAASLLRALSISPSRSAAGFAFVSPSAMTSIAEGAASFIPRSSPAVRVAYFLPEIT